MKGDLAFCCRSWATFYRQRWQPPHRVPGSWQQAYAGKVIAGKGYADRFRMDSLFGHGGAVRACCLLPACNAIVTGEGSAANNTSVLAVCDMQTLASKASVHNLTPLLPLAGSEDQTVRLWDLEAGLPLASSRPLGSTVRCVAADEGLIVCATTGDHAIRAWRPVEVWSGRRQA